VGVLGYRNCQIRVRKSDRGCRISPRSLLYKDMWISFLGELRERVYFVAFFVALREGEEECGWNRGEVVLGRVYRGVGSCCWRASRLGSWLST